MVGRMVTMALGLLQSVQDVHRFPGDSIVAFWFLLDPLKKTDKWLIFWTQAGLELELPSGNE